MVCFFVGAIIYLKTVIQNNNSWKFVLVDKWLCEINVSTEPILSTAIAAKLSKHLNLAVIFI